MLRFFESKAADFVLENKVFSICGQNDFSPHLIDTDGTTYRIEEFYTGSPLTYQELTDPAIIEKTSVLLCDFNYNSSLRSIQEIKKENIKSIEYIESENGWYWKAKRLVYPLLDKIDVVLVMSVEPGFGGQGYLPGSNERIASIKSFLSDNCLDRVQIEVDGGIKLHNAKEVLMAGADILVAGSEVFRSEDPVETIKEFYQTSN